jgi:hypothetical protein
MKTVTGQTVLNFRMPRCPIFCKIPVYMKPTPLNLYLLKAENENTPITCEFKVFYSRTNTMPDSDDYV